MNETFQNIPLQFSTFGLLTFLGLASVLFVLLRGLRRLLKYVPMGRARRAQFDVFVPITETIFWVTYLLTALPMVVNDHPDYAPYVLVGIIVGLAWVSWYAIRDFVNGVFFKAGQICQAGDHVQIGELEGRVISLGYRTLIIETSDGNEAVIPYSQVSRQSVMRTPIVTGEIRYAFTIETSDPATVGHLKKVILRTALNNHWSSLTRDPEIEATSPEEIQVTVYALDDDRGPDIEAAVRHALE